MKKMNDRIGDEYYTDRKPELLLAFDEESQHWILTIVVQYGEDFAHTLIERSREEFEALLPHIPYIGGDENHLTDSLVGSARYLAFYKAMKKYGRTAEETGKVLYDAALAQTDDSLIAIPPSEMLMLTTEQLMERRRRRAERSEERRYSEDYVYKFVIGDGEDFDYGYDFLECAALKFYRAQGANEFTPFYCFLDYPKSTMGLSRTMTLAEGHAKCNHRFTESRKSKFGWPPPFLKRE
jgi:hypothetical protein